MFIRGGQQDNGKTARWLGIAQRGEIRPGYFAEIVLFNPDTIADNTSVSEIRFLLCAPFRIRFEFIWCEFAIVSLCVYPPFQSTFLPEC